MRSKEAQKKMLIAQTTLARWQRGGLTIFTGIFVLILLTLMLLYATRVGVFEQRVSSNEVRQKIAFHAAESVVDQGVEYLLANSGRIFSASAQAMPYDSGGGTVAYRVGWFANDGTTPGWNQCTATMIAKPNHPCGGDIPATTTSFFYDDPTTSEGDVTGADSIPINVTGLPAASTARLTAVLCLIDASDPSGTCLGAPSGSTEENEAIAVMQLMGYGFSDCTNTADLTTCAGEARVSRPLSNYKNLSGSPGVPLTTKSIFPPTGTAEVVGNPNGGGVGVPLTTWINDNPACSAGSDIQSSGSWQTCELQEWYSVDYYPDDIACPANGGCGCGPGGNDTDYFLSWRNAGSTNVNIDIVIDDTFPCDLFEFYFNVPRNLYHVVKAAATVISDCNSLGPWSSGFYWVSGAECRISADTQVGSPNNPIMLVSAATSTDLRGGAEIYGTLYVFDGEDINATMNSTGTNTVYGAVIVDAVIGSYNGTFQIVYAEQAIAGAAGLNGVGSVSGGWRDFGLPAWQ